MTLYYLVIVWDDVEPEIQGPFDTKELRDLTARGVKFISGDDHGIFKLTDTDGKLSVASYTNAFFNEEAAEEP